jgi:predicted O-methyltransferase YrrM
VSPNGTAAYDAVADLPALVARAVNLARHEGFAHSCRPEHGRLLFALAAGAEVIGETGTGCGVGLAWLASGARPGGPGWSASNGTPGGRRRRRSCSLARPQVTVIAGDWLEIHPHGPFDLLVLDGGAHGKASPPAADPDVLLRPGGTLVIDDLIPARDWPPRYAGGVDEARMSWLGYPGLDAAELRLAPDLAALVATRRFPTAG